MRAAALVLAASLAAGAVDASSAPNFSAAGRGSEAAVDALLRRVLAKPHPFELKLVAGCAAPPPAAARSKLSFELGPGSAAGKVSLSGTSGVELARGAAHYLRRRCNMSFAWPRTGGNQVAAPADWPAGCCSRRPSRPANACSGRFAGRPTSSRAPACRSGAERRAASSARTTRRLPTLSRRCAASRPRGGPHARAASVCCSR